MNEIKKLWANKYVRYGVILAAVVAGFFLWKKWKANRAKKEQEKEPAAPEKTKEGEGETATIVEPPILLVPKPKKVGEAAKVSEASNTKGR